MFINNIQALNAITPQTDLESINFLLDSPNGKCLTGTTLSERIGILLVWSVTPLQYGEHRPHAVAALLRQWKEKQDERALRRECSSDLSGSEDFLHDCLFDWLDTSEVAGDPKNLPAVALLYFKLIKHNLFSFSKYTQRLIARGDIGLPVTDVSQPIVDIFITHIRIVGGYIPPPKLSEMDTLLRGSGLIVPRAEITSLRYSGSGKP